jgi:Glycosyl hydrolase family 26
VQRSISSEPEPNREGEIVLGKRSSILMIPLLCLVLAPANAPAGTPQTSVGAPTVAPPSGALLGAWVKNQKGLTHYESVIRFERRIKRRLSIDNHFRTWDNRYWREEAKDLAAGRIPMVTWGDWGRTSAGEINTGSQDSLIREKARAIGALDGPVLLRWAPEMAGGNYGSAQSYIAAWERIRDLFAEEGATNVIWVWCPTAWSFETGAAEAYYPGDSQVDWIAADGYNWYPAKGRWKPLRDIFGGFYSWASARGKPLMIAATGTMEDPKRPRRKARWFRDVVRFLKQRPALKAFVYLHATSPKGYEFSVDTSRRSMRAFRRMAGRAYMK